MLLAQETGGFFAENTNDLARAAARVAADRRFHYLLTYTPKNTGFDGTWRTLTLRVPGRRGVEVRARSGYLATPTPTTAAFLAYEAPAIAALERTPAPADLPLRACALAFPHGQESRVAVLASVDAAALRFDRDEAAGTYRTDFSILARILDEQGQVVRKSSELEILQAGRRVGATPLTLRPPDLSGRLEHIAQVPLAGIAPGRYTLRLTLADGDARVIRDAEFEVVE